jgi:peptidoglycan/xylan/chitin deacetylase (PgdA/CDA1 family)
MTILCYHGIDPDWHSPLAVPPDRFHRQLSWLARHRTIVDLPVALSGRAGRPVALTFDDGLASSYEHAWPQLRRRGLPATMFVVAGTLADPPTPLDWIEEADLAGRPQRVLSAGQVEEMAAGGVRIGSHSHRHHVLTGLGDDECRRDLRDSRLLLEDLLRRPVTLLAYPRGHHDARVRRLARLAGYTHGFTTDAGGRRGDPYAIGRAGVYGGDSAAVFRAKLSRCYLPARSGQLSPLVTPVLRGMRRAAAAARPRPAAPR